MNERLAAVFRALRLMRFLICVCLLSVVLCGCQSAPRGEAPRAAIASMADMTSLASSLEPVRDYFNAHAERDRFVAILSSTCGPCISGAVAVNESVLRSFPDAHLSVSIVWIDMLRSDNESSARQASTIYGDSRVAQFYDPNKLTGEAFGAELTNGYPAWDIYMFFSAGQRWDDEAPVPVEWMHQLGGRVADPNRFRGGSALAPALHTAMRELGFEAAGPPPDAQVFAAARKIAIERVASVRAGTVGGQAPPQCSRCAKVLGSSQCRLSGWTYVEARRAPPADGSDIAFDLGGSSEIPESFATRDPRSRRLVFAISGIECPDGIASIALQVLSLRDVNRVEVSYERQQAIVYLDSAGDADRVDAIVTTLEDAGYEAKLLRKLERAMDVELLYFDGCPLSPQLRENLRRAIVLLGVEIAVRETDLEALREGDPLLRYAAPTVLVDGRDLMGSPPRSSAALSCRLYPGGLPDAETLASRLGPLIGE